MITRTENSGDISDGCFSLKTVSSGKRGSINQEALQANVVSELYSTNSQTIHTIDDYYLLRFMAQKSLRIFRF